MGIENTERLWQNSLSYGTRISLREFAAEILALSGWAFPWGGKVLNGLGSGRIMTVAVFDREIKQKDRQQIK